MLIRNTLLPGFDDEMGKTRKILERVPVEDGDWTPHKKSMTLGRLASHIAAIPHWGVNILSTEIYDAPAGAKQFQAATARELLQHFDEEVAASRKLVEQADDDHFTTVWQFLYAGHQVFSKPRYAAFRMLLMDHLIHHRGQLSVYLRLKDIAVPGMYGPSADER